MFNVSGKKSEEQLRDLQLVAFTVTLENLTKSQDKVDAALVKMTDKFDEDLEKVTDKFTNFSESISKQLDKIANNLEAETTSLKRDLKDFESQKKEVQELQEKVKEYETYWKNYKNQCIENNKTFLGIKRGLFDWIIRGFIIFFVVEVIDYIRNPPQNNQPTIERKSTK